MTNIPLRSWINKNIPVIFCNVAGKEDYLPFDTDEGNEQSCSNQEEVEHVVCQLLKYVWKSLLITTEWTISYWTDYAYICMAKVYKKKVNFISEGLSKVRIE